MSSTSQPERRSYDQTLKRMLSQAPNDLVALYDPRLAPIEAAREDALVAVVAHVTTDSLDEARARLCLPEGK